MTERARRLHRLEIIYPEGSHDPGWRPAVWGDPEYLKTLTRKQRRELYALDFRWPRERVFLSSSGAYGRAALLRFYGAAVEVLASDPVTWPNYDNWEADERAWQRGTTAARFQSNHDLVADINAEQVDEETFTLLMLADGADDLEVSGVQDR